MNTGRSGERCEATWALDPCLVCGSCENSLLYPTTYTGSIDEASSYFLAHRTATAYGNLVRCGDCGFVFTSPRFSAADYDRIYMSVRRPLTVEPSFESAEISRFRRLAAIVRKFQPREVPFLDFGCGGGGFLRQYHSRAGWGFEIGARGRRQAEPCEIVTGKWAEIAGSEVFPPATFDFIVAFDVLEHLPRIKEDIALIRTVLKPRGMLFVSVPNIESWAARAMGKRWHMLLLEHLWYFSPRSLEHMLVEHGFEAIDIHSLPYDASIGHIATRLAQTLGMRGTLRAGPISRLVLPTPAGIMLGVFRKTG